MSRILIVEDDGSVALALRNELTTEGYAVQCAGDGETALQCLRDERFDLILLDIVLPKKDGYTVCREVRATGDRTPILMLTANTRERDKLVGFQQGTDDYLTKPFSSLELVARVQALLRRAGANEIHQFGNVTVDLTRGEIRVDGEVNDTVTALEYKLLSLFVRRRGHILTRGQLIDECWPLHSNPTDRVVDNHIMHLRRKIEPKPEEPIYLKNVRGLGYRFDG